MYTNTKSLVQELQEDPKKMVSGSGGGMLGSYLFPRDITTIKEELTSRPLMAFATNKKPEEHPHFSAEAFRASEKSPGLESTCTDAPAWRLTSLSAALQESLSPRYSGGFSPRSFATTSTVSESFYSQGTTEFSSPKFQSTRSNFTKLSISSTEADGWAQCGRNATCILQNHTDSKIMDADVCSKLCLSGPFGYDSTTIASTGPKCPTASTGMGGSTDKNSPEPESTHNNYCSDGESMSEGRHKLMSRPKPYNEFLDEVKAQELQTRIDAWKKAKARELLTKLTQEEAKIRDWESKQIAKATKEMKKIERKLEKKRLMAKQRAQERIGSVRKEATTKVLTTRDKALKKISAILRGEKIPAKSSKSTKMFCH